MRIAAVLFQKVQGSFLLRPKTTENLQKCVKNDPGILPCINVFIECLLILVLKLKFFAFMSRNINIPEYSRKFSNATGNCLRTQNSVELQSDFVILVLDTSMKSSWKFYRNNKRDWHSKFLPKFLKFSETFCKISVRLSENIFVFEKFKCLKKSLKSRK